jgi:hypothetical protein
MSLVALALVILVYSGLLRSLSLNTNASWVDSQPTHISSYRRGNAGQILLPALADGAEVGPCLLDSGAQAKMMAISPGAAKRARLRIFPLLPWSIANGSYGSTGFLTNRTAGEFQVGPIVLKRPRLVEIPDLEMMAGASVGLGADSICSAAIFQAATIDIDWRSGMISFYKPEVTPTQLGSIKWIPLIEFKGLPFVRLTVEGKHEGLFLIDTGMESAIHLFSHVVEKHQLLANRTVRL